ncbi:MAG TPA: UDP-glucose/GDP-mannose dehydrogenase family protein [Acidimicrobiales bacterium]|nr:UDP-glucose/GDP-mannose dehydrogenase family protein [Acidimicrobiales bacterium]
MSTPVERAQVPPASRRRVAVIGAGYVGLPTAAVLAHFGHQVVLAERDPARFELLARGDMPIVENGLAELFGDAVAAGNLRVVQRAVDATVDAQFVFLCVPTPQDDDGSADLSYVEAVAAEIADHLAPGAVVVNKSTVPVGTARLVEAITGRGDVAVVSNPEFLREGTAVRDSLHPDRIVVGADDPRAASRVGELFAPTGAPVIVTDKVTAETIKYAANAFLATKLSFVNALAGLCESLGADVRDVVLGLGYDKRIGFDFLRPGPGWGGSCLPKDTSALIHIAQRAGYDFALLRGAVSSNDDQLARVVAKVVAAAPPDRAAADRLDGVTVAVWGLTFKADTDDRRSSPAVAIARRLLDLGAAVRAYDPTVPPSPRAVPGRAADDLHGMTLCADPYDACRAAAAAVLLTEWADFRDLDFTKVRDLMARPSVIDARNLLDPAALRRVGFTYTGVGRP